MLVQLQFEFGHKDYKFTTPSIINFRVYIQIVII